MGEVKRGVAPYQYDRTQNQRRVGSKITLSLQIFQKWKTVR